MGSDTFGVYSVGKDPKEAFDAAVSSAQYDYGHAGYTGTIAEKDSFTMLDCWGFSAAEFDEIYNKVLGETGWGSRPVVGPLTIRIGYGDKATDLEIREDLARYMIEKVFPATDDKWGPAGCIVDKDTPNGYYFFGWASS